MKGGNKPQLHFLTYISFYSLLHRRKKKIFFLVWVTQILKGAEFIVINKMFSGFKSICFKCFPFVCFDDNLSWS